MKNQEQLKEIAQRMPIFGQLRGSSILWDKDAAQTANQVREFAGANEAFRSDLSQAAYAYKDGEQNYIADLAAPMFPVQTLTGKYRKLDERTFYDAPAANAGKDTPPNRINFGSEYVNFDLTGRALAMYLSKVDLDEAVNQWGSVAKFRKICTDLLTRLLLLDRELAVASLYQTSGNYASGFTATPTVWSAANSTPQADVVTAEDTILTPRDLLVMGHNVYRALQQSAAVKGATTVSGAKRSEMQPFVNQDVIKYFFDSEIIVGSARYNSTPKSGTPTLTNIWKDYVTVCHLGSNPGGDELSAPFVRTFKLQSSAFPNVNGWTVKTVPDNSTIAGGEILMVGYFSDEVIFAQKSGYLIKAL